MTQAAISLSFVGALQPNILPELDLDGFCRDIGFMFIPHLGNNDISGRTPEFLVTTALTFDADESGLGAYPTSGTGYANTGPTNFSLGYTLFAVCSAGGSAYEAIMDDDTGGTRGFQFRFTNTGAINFIPFTEADGFVSVASNNYSAAELAAGVPVVARVDASGNIAVFGKGGKFTGSLGAAPRIPGNVGGTQGVRFFRWKGGGNQLTKPLYMAGALNRVVSDDEAFAFIASRGNSAFKSQSFDIVFPLDVGTPIGITNILSLFSTNNELQNLKIAQSFVSNNLSAVNQSQSTKIAVISIDSKLLTNSSSTSSVVGAISTDIASSLGVSNALASQKIAIATVNAALSSYGSSNVSKISIEDIIISLAENASSTYSSIQAGIGVTDISARIDVKGASTASKIATMAALAILGSETNLTSSKTGFSTQSSNLAINNLTTFDTVEAGVGVTNVLVALSSNGSVAAIKLGNSFSSMDLSLYDNIQTSNKIAVSVLNTTQAIAGNIFAVQIVDGAQLASYVISLTASIKNEIHQSKTVKPIIDRIFKWPTI